MSEKPKAAIDGVDVPQWPTRPPHRTVYAGDPGAWQEVVLVDRHGKPLIVRQPRTIGFRIRE